MNPKINQEILKRKEKYAVDFFDAGKQDESKIMEILLNSTNFDNIKNKIALESYILKNYDVVSEVERQGMDEFLKILYKTFLKNPSQMLDSYLLQSPKIVDKFCPDVTIRKDGKALPLSEMVKDRYRGISNSAKALFEKDRDKDNLTKGEIDILMHMLKKSIGTTNPEIEKMQREYIKKLLDQDKDLTELTPSQIEFFGKYFIEKAQNERLKETGHSDWKEDIDFFVVEDGLRGGGLSTDNNIFLKPSFEKIESLEKIAEIMCHETEHWMQKKLAEKDDKTKAGLDAAANKVIKEYYKTHHKGFDVYHENYRFNYIELDAENVGVEKSTKYLMEFGHPEKAENIRNYKRSEFDRRQFEYAAWKNEKGDTLPYEYFAFETLTMAVKERPSILNENKALTALYNQDGERKSFEEIVSGDFKINQEDKNDIYEDFCNAYIADGSLENLDLSNFPEDIQCKIASRLISLLGTEKLKISKMDKKEDPANVTGKSSNVMDNQTKQFIETYHLEVSKKIMSFIGNNYAHLRQMQDEGKFSSIINMDNFDTYVNAFEYGRIYENLALEGNPYLETVQQVAKDVKEKKQEYEKEPEEQIADRKSLNTKKRFIGDLLDAYDSVEEDFQYEKRVNQEENDINRVKEIVDSEGLNRILTMDLEGTWRVGKNENEVNVVYSQKEVAALIRLMKASQLLSQDKSLNPEGIDYVQKFTSLPEINRMLIQLKDDALKDKDSYVAELFERSKLAKENGQESSHEITNGEKSRGITLDSIKKSIYGVRMSEIDNEAKTVVEIKKDELGIDSQNLDVGDRQ